VKRLRAAWLGRQPYARVQALQEHLLVARQRGVIEDTLLLLEHEPVVTLGRGAKPEHLLSSREALAARGVELASSSRGGDVTLHAPGQLVAYPIVDLTPDRRDVRRWVKTLTEVMRRLASEYGVAAGLHEKHVGLWADRAAPGRFTDAASALDLVKIGAIGVRISRWVTMHGFALNLAPDLAEYQVIVPCGIREHGVSSIAALGGRAPNVERSAEQAHAVLAELLGSAAAPLEVRSVEELAAELEPELRAAP